MRGKFSYHIQISNVRAYFSAMDELTRLRKENVSLLETKDALNTVKDDLIKELEQIASQYAKIKLELDMAKKEKGLKALIASIWFLDSLHGRVNSMESDLARMKSSLADEDEADQVEEDPTEKRKRFTRVEMARVLMERNQYKERLMELQEAVRWTEMLRASKHDQIQQHKGKSQNSDQGYMSCLAEHQVQKKPSSVYGFFSRLFGGNTGGNAPAEVAQTTGSPDEETKTLSPSNSTELSHLGKVAGFVQGINSEIIKSPTAI